MEQDLQLPKSDYELPKLDPENKAKLEELEKEEAQAENLVNLM
jgi:hypothetical protein